MPAQTPLDPSGRKRTSAPPPTSAGGATRMPPASTARPLVASRQAPAPHNAQRMTVYWPTLVALSLLCALLVVLVFLIVARVDLTTAVADLLRDPQSLSMRELALLVLSISSPLAAALTSYLIGAQVVRLLRISLYLRRLHAYSERRLRDGAPLYKRGIPPRVLPVSAGESASLPPQQATVSGLPVQRLLSAGGPVLLTGEAGSGKTAALLTLAHELTRPSALLPVFLGRRRLPVLVPLSAMAGTHGEVLHVGPYLADLQAQVARYGSAGLAARLPRWLGNGRILLLCDSLSDVSLGLQSHVLQRLAQLCGASRWRGVPLVVARAGTLGEAFPNFLAADASNWRHWRVAPLPNDDVLRIAQSSAGPGGARRPAQQQRQLRDDLQARRLDRALDKPSYLLSYTALRSRERPIPYGRAALIEQALDAACASAETDELPAEALRDTLATLASALANADMRAVPLSRGLRLGEALAGWLAAHRPYSPLLALKSGPLAIPPEVAQACCIAALKAGLLVVTSDDAGITFANSLVEAACAAAWLRSADDGASPFDPGLLRPRWTLPVILWTATAPDPGIVTRRLLPLASARPESHNTLALATVVAQARPTSAAAASLALGGLTAAVAPAVSSFQMDGGDHGFEIARFERRLREVLDGVLEVLTRDPDPTLLTRAVQTVEGEGGDELAADIAYLAGFSALSRLARAQLLTVLGLLASPLALTALVAHLADRDPTLRSAVNRGFALRGTATVPVLQQQLTSPDEWSRARAREALDAVGAATKVDGGTAAQRAVRGLTSPDPRERAAAALTLGALRSYGAADALTGRLGDPDAHVRIATLEALGNLVDPTVLDALRAAADDHDPAVRAALAETFGAYRDATVLADLVTLLGDSDGSVRAAAATALGVLGDGRAVHPLIARRDDPDPHTQAAVAGALRRLGDTPEAGISSTLIPRLSLSVTDGEAGVRQADAG